MYKQVLKQLFNRKKDYVLISIIISLSFFIFSLLYNFVHIYLVNAFTPRLPVEVENRVELRLDWNRNERWKEPNRLRTEFKERIKRIPNVLAADYVVNEMVQKNLMSSVDEKSENTFIFYCGEELPAVFDFKLIQGNWFKHSAASIDNPQVVITQNHATYLGIKQLEKHTSFKVKTEYRDTVCYKVVGIIENVKNMCGSNSLERKVFPLFTSENSISHRARQFSNNESLVLKMAEDYSFSELNTSVQKLITDLKLDDVTMSRQLISMNRRMKNGIKDHFAETKIIYLFIFIAFSYLFVSLFSSFWKIAQKRVVEIGIRRAIGHCKKDVLWYVLCEALMVYCICIALAIIICNVQPISAMLDFSLAIYLVSGALILSVILLASIIPSVRACRVHPVKALSEE